MTAIAVRVMTASEWKAQSTVFPKRSRKRKKELNEFSPRSACLCVSRSEREREGGREREGERRREKERRREGERGREGERES